MPKPKARPTEEKEPLPELKEIAAREIRLEIDQLLIEAHELREAEKQLKEIKERLGTLLSDEGLPGIRSGFLGVKVRWQGGRTSLDRTLLIENGVTPDQIEASMKTGAPFKVVELIEVE